MQITTEFANPNLICRQRGRSARQQGVGEFFEAKSLVMRRDFTLAPRYGMPPALALEEARSLLLPNGIRCRADSKCNGTAVILKTEQGNLSGEAADSLLSRLVSATAYWRGTSKIVNDMLLALSPNDIYAPLFDECGAVRHVYRPTNRAGATGAKYSALMVNLLGLKPASMILVPTGGYLGETIAGALAGHRVLVGDISPWVITGREKLRLYSGESTIALPPSCQDAISQSIAMHRERGMPLDLLRNVSFFRWNAANLPFRDGAFDGTVFDPPFGRATKPEGAVSSTPIEAAIEFLQEAARVTKKGGPVVMRVPDEWSSRLGECSSTLSLVGAFEIQGDRMALLKFRKN